MRTRSEVRPAIRASDTTKSTSMRNDARLLSQRLTISANQMAFNVQLPDGAGSGFQRAIEVIDNQCKFV